MIWIAPSEKDTANTTLEKRLWDAADQFRANSGLKSQEYSAPVLGLIFLRFAEVRFTAQRAKLEKAAATGGSGHSPRRGSRVDDPTAYNAEGILYLPAEARFDYLLNLPEAENIGAKVNAAMRDIEKQNPQLAGVLPKTYNLFTSTLLKELLKKVSEIPATVNYDAFGRIYEYFLGEFARTEGQKGGEFYTPAGIVRLLTEIIEPYHGRILDPACGSGGMFVQSARFVSEHKRNPAAPPPTPSSPALLPAGEGSGHYRGGFNFSGLKERARELRKKQTPAEELLWELLRDRQCCELKFRRQHQFGDYLLDFYCHEAKLAVELDGEPHSTAARQKKDATRDAYLKSQGVTSLRFENRVAIETPEMILEAIARHAASASPSGRGGGEGGCGYSGDPSRELSIHGHEKVGETMRLCRMNLAIHGLEGDIREAITYYEDPFDACLPLPLGEGWGEGASSHGRFDFVLANPPFNVNAVDKERLKDSVGPGRRFPFGLPRTDNANYLWIQLFYSALNEKGRSGFVMANSASDARASEQEIRKQLIQARAVDVMVAVGPNMFYTVTLPCTLWFLDKAKAKLPPSPPSPLPLGEGRKDEGRTAMRGGYRFSGLVERARQFRKNQTQAEVLLWELLRDRQFENLKFRRQHQIGDYLVDLYCHEYLLVVEADGDVHDTGYQKKHDAKRDAYLKSLGITVIRFRNDDILNNTESVLARLADSLPSPVGRRVGDEGLPGSVPPNYTGGRYSDTVLFIDARHIFRQIDRAHREWTPAQIGFLANIVRLYRGEALDFTLGGDEAKAKISEVFGSPDAFPSPPGRGIKGEGAQRIGEGSPLTYQDVPGFCKAAKIEQIAANGWSLNPGRYVGVAPGEAVSDEDFKEQLETLNEELETLNAQARELEATIAKNVTEILEA